MIRAISSTLRQLRCFNYFWNHKYFYWKYPLCLARRFLTGSGLIFAEIFFERRCNFRCWHCSSSDLLSHKEIGLSLEQIETVLEQLQRQNVISVSYVGGETAIRENLTEIIRLTHRKYRMLPSMVSNGWLLTPKVIDDLFSAGLANIGLSLQSSRPETHDALVKKPGAHARVMAAFHHCLDKGYPVSICAVPTNENLADGDFDEIMRMCTGFGVRVNINLPAAVGSLEDEHLLTKSALARLQEQHFDNDYFLPDFKMAGAGQKVWCPMGEASVYVMPGGEICPCTFTQVSFGNILEEDLGIILQRMRGSSLLRGLKRDGQCPISMDRDFIAKVRAAMATDVHYPPRWKPQTVSGERTYWGKHYEDMADSPNDLHFQWLAGRRYDLFRRIGAEDGGRSLEIGAGRGEFASLAGTGLVSDLSMDAVAQASTATGALGMVADAARLPLADGSLDICYANDVFHHIKLDYPLTMVMTEIERVLAPGGLLCISDRRPTIYNSLLLGINSVGRAVLSRAARLLGRRLPLSGGELEPPMTRMDWDVIDRPFTLVGEIHWRSPVHFWIYAFQQVANLVLPAAVATAIARRLIRLADLFEAVTPQSWCQDRCVVLRKKAVSEG